MEVPKGFGAFFFVNMLCFLVKEQFSSMKLSRWIFSVLRLFRLEFRLVAAREN